MSDRVDKQHSNAADQPTLASSLPPYAVDTVKKETEDNSREQERAELQEAQEKLVRMETLATLGQIAAGIVHEIRNPLGVIRNAVYFLQQIQIIGNQDVTDALSEIERGVRKSERIVSELLDFAQSRQPELRIFRWDEAIRAALNMVEIPRNVSVELPASSEIVIHADREQIERLMANLIQNAIQAMPDGGKLTVRCNIADGCSFTEVIDTGVGIAAHELEKIFEPLFTKRAKGFGLGLPLCRRYAAQNGGSLFVESELGKGTTFTFALPIERKNT